MNKDELFGNLRVPPNLPNSIPFGHSDNRCLLFIFSQNLFTTTVYLAIECIDLCLPDLLLKVKWSFHAPGLE